MARDIPESEREKKERRRSLPRVRESERSHRRVDEVHHAAQAAIRRNDRDAIEFDYGSRAV